MIQSLLIGIGIPFIASLGLVLGSLFLPQRFSKSFRAVGIPLLFLSSYYHFTGLPPWPPNGSNESIFFIAAASPLLALFRGRSFALSVIYFFLSSYVATAVTLIPLLRFQGLGMRTQFILLGFSLLGLLIWISTRAVLTQRKAFQWVGLMVLAATFAGIAGHLMAGSSALLAFLSASCAGIALALGLVQLKGHKRTDLGELSPFFALMLLSLLACDYYFSS